MRVLLINPPTENLIVADNPSFIDEERGFNPPLGLLYIAAYVKKHSSHEIEVLDMPVENIRYKQLPDVIRQRAPDIVGITAMTFTLIDVLRTIKIVKAVSKDTKVVLGGAHVSIYPLETIRIPEVDFVVRREGEITFLKLLDNLHNKEELRKIKGLVFKDNSGAVINTGPNEFIEDLDSLPFPARDLVPYKKYSSVLSKHKFITTMFTSRGCPFKCSFCDRPHMGRRFRMRSAEDVVDEMQTCLDSGIKEILIYDDTFTVNRKRVIDICSEILSRALNITWDIRARVDTVDEEMLNRLKEAHCERIHYGVEAGTEKILKVLNKGVNLSQIEEAFRLTKKAGLSTLAYFMIGSPTETKADILKTIDFAKRLNPDYVHITITTPFPSTDLYKLALEEKVITQDYWREFAQEPSKGVVSRYWERELNRKELLSLLDLAYKSFYLRPRYIVKKLLDIRSFRELTKDISTGIKLARAVCKSN